MFGKLLKYDFFLSLKAVSVSYIALFGIFAGELISSKLDMTWLTILLGVGLVFGGGVVLFMSFVTLARLFHDTMFSAQGYLSFTLPVKTSSLFLSKVLVSTSWTIISGLLLIGTFVMNYLVFKQQTDAGSSGAFLEVIQESGILEMFPSTSVLIQYAIATAFLMLCSITSFWSFVFFAITVANTQKLQAHPKLYGFAIFFALNSVVNSISAKITELLPLSIELGYDKMSLSFSSMASSEALFAVGIGGTIFNVIVAIGLIAITMWIIENKVDIKG